MNRLIALLLNLIISSAAFAGEATQQQDASMFFDQDLEQYIKVSEPSLPLQNPGRDKNELLKKEPYEAYGAKVSAVTESRTEISACEEKKNR